MPQTPTSSNLSDALKVFGAGVVGFLVAFGLLLLALQKDLARNPAPASEGHVHGILLPSLEGALLAALIAVLFIIRRRIRARTLPGSSIE